MITQWQNDQLTKSIGTWEIHEALKSLAKNKSPDWDRVPSKFFEECSGQIQLQLLGVVQVMRTGTLSIDLNRGLITLTLKEGDLTLVINFRPITSLRIFYKLVAKILARRLQPLLSTMIQPNKTGYAHGPCIIDNISGSRIIIMGKKQ